MFITRLPDVAGFLGYGYIPYMSNLSHREQNSRDVRPGTIPIQQVNDNRKVKNNQPGRGLLLSSDEYGKRLIKNSQAMPKEMLPISEFFATHKPHLQFSTKMPEFTQRAGLVNRGCK